MSSMRLTFSKEVTASNSFLSPIITVATEVVTGTSECVNIYGEGQDISRVSDIVFYHYAVMVPPASIKL